MKLLSGVFFTLMINTALAAPLDIDEPWQWFSDPSLKSSDFTYNFADLPLEGQVKAEQKFWSGDYWAFKFGGINLRWNADKVHGHKLVSPNRSQLFSMSLEDLAKLAPSEKYDLFTGRYDYPLRDEVAAKTSYRAKEWEGICHGWAPAAMNHKEPTPKVMINPDGVAIPFGSSDIKALISYYYAFGFEVENTHQMGRRCFKGEFLNFDKDCSQDLNAGAFHVVLTNKIGIEKAGFLADMDRFKEVWNHPVYGYKTVVVKDNIKPKRSSARGSKKLIHLKSEVFYITENENRWDPVLGTKDQLIVKKDYEYFLDIDADNNIIGGEWKSKERPDFLWTKTRPEVFEGLLYRVGELLND